MPKVFTTLCITLGLIAAAFVISRAFISLRSEKDIEVKGYAELAVKADVGRLTFALSAQQPERAQAATQLAAALTQIKEAVAQAGFEANTVTATPLSVSAVYQKTKEGNQTNVIEGYRAVQTVELTAHDVSKVAQLCESVGGLIAQGLECEIGGPYYFISDVEPLKKQLITQATSNGHEHRHQRLRQLRHL